MINAVRAFILAFALCWMGAAAADVAVPPLTGRVVDQTGTLSGSDISSLTQKLKDFETRRGSQIAVLIVPTTAPETIEQYSIRVAEAWKIGRKRIDDGALLVIAKNDRHLRIEVGYGVEGSLTDLTTKRIIDEDITPKFKTGDFSGGVSAGVDRMIAVIEGEKLPAPEPPHWQDPGLLSNIDPLNPFVIIAVFAVGAMLRTTLGRLFGSAATGGMVGFLAWLFVGSIAAAFILGIIVFIFSMFAGPMAAANMGAGPGPYYRRSGGGYGGPYSGGWGGGGSSGESGGFSGGGGSFGGGGASGSW